MLTDSFRDCFTRPLARSFEHEPKAGVLPPAGVATRKITFEGMKESSLYWAGEARSVRRRGGSPVTGAPAFNWTP